MKTKEIPAIVMLIAGGVYCLLGIFYQIPLLDFCVQLLIVLLVFWVLGGIVRMVLDHFIGEIEDKIEEENTEDDAEGEPGEVDSVEEVMDDTDE